MTEENETKQNPRGSGYSTRQKASLIRFLESHPEEFLTAKEIHEGLVASGEKIGYTTVYRLVNALSEEGKLKKFLTKKGGPIVFEFAPGHDEAEFHVQCKVCRKLFHLHCGEIERTAEELKHPLDAEHGILIDFQNSVFQGICPACRRKAEQNHQD